MSSSTVLLCARAWSRSSPGAMPPWSSTRWRERYRRRDGTTSWPSSPPSFAPLLPRGPYVEVVDAETFLGRVAERAGTDREQAKRATDAVLQTLAERIAGGEVEDLIERLPTQLHPPLKRGREITGGQAKRMTLEGFVRAIAELEGVTPSRPRRTRGRSSVQEGDPEADQRDVHRERQRLHLARLQQILLMHRSERRDSETLTRSGQRSASCRAQ
jgi:uncharacterized protein (DUF2267 family)